MSQARGRRFPKPLTHVPLLQIDLDQEDNIQGVAYIAQIPQSPLTFQMDKDEDIVSERPSSLARNYESLGVEVHSMDAQDYVCLESHSRPPSQPKIDHKINSRTATVSAKHLLDSVGHTSVVGLRRETSNIASPPLVDSICSKSSMSLTSLPSLPRGVPYSSKLQTRLACSKRMQPGHGAVNVRIDDT
eukprot:CAMPEP_0169157412 /NCGR_PEP_ID=MMETSP1015-20121227/54573_1 /TAXON_ID=342587 /ORGANISM="Karlodinium micrum, Strain CCMP2283" /LENGTH=187 /DNA_ID=CAMNT_0009228351 /DNA_START=43 /DNA_END=603 /DNA_ORIENTATION=-